MIHPFEKLRYKFEYSDCSIRDLCSKYEFLDEQVEQYAKDHNWTKKEVPAVDDIEKTNTYYTVGRNTLTILSAQRALTTWGDFVDIEDTLIDAALKGAETLRNAKFMDPLDLVRVTQVYKTLIGLRQMYSEAILVPSITDKDLKSLLKAGSAQSLKDIAAILKDKNIPIPDIPTEDLEDES